MSRQCSKTGCSGPAVATLTYVYRDSTAVLGPLATYAEPLSAWAADGSVVLVRQPDGDQSRRLAPENITVDVS